MSFSNQLNPAQAERLAILLEELGETAQAIGKILRHGYESRNPYEPGGHTNREMLESECGDILHALDRMVEAGDVSRKHIEHWRQAKAERIEPFLHHQAARSKP